MSPPQEEEEKKPCDQSAHINLKVKGQVWSLFLCSAAPLLVKRVLSVFSLASVVTLLQTLLRAMSNARSVAFCVP